VGSRRRDVEESASHARPLFASVLFLCMEAMHRPVGAESRLVPSRKSVAYSEDRYSFRHGVSTKQRFVVAGVRHCRHIG
jgi:hypothetical protein